MKKQTLCDQPLGWQCSHTQHRRGVFIFTLGVWMITGIIHNVGYTPQARAAGLPGGNLSLDAETFLELEGRLEPRDFAQLTISLPGRIDQVLVEEGDQVEAGSVLLRLDGYEEIEADLAAAELEMVLAQQILDDLYRYAEINLAEATLAKRQAEHDRVLAEDLLASLQSPHAPQAIDQAYANLLLAEESLEKAREDYRKAEQKFNNQKNPIWMFIGRHQYRLLLNQMGKAVAYYERRYWDAKEKYEDRLAPPEAIDLALAEAALTEAEARQRQAERELVKWLNGPDPDALETAQARLQAAQTRLKFAQTVARNAELSAPIAGEVVAVNAKPGEWVTPGQTVVTIADLSQWTVVTQDLGEDSVSNLQVGMPVNLKLKAFPESFLQGVVESISLYAEEEDGDVYYQAKIAVQESPDSLRWGMTAIISPEDQ